MKHLNMLIWLTQLGLSVALPLTGFLLLGVWLHTAKGWGVWTVIAGLALGLICSIRSFLDAVKAMELMSRNKNEQKPPLSFNKHN